MDHLFLFLSGAFLFTFLVGQLLEKIRVPWVFAGLLFGFLLAVRNPFSAITDSNTFTFLGKMGMYFLLFMVGLEIDVRKLMKMGRFIVRGTFFIIFLEALLGGLFIHSVFGTTWPLSFLVSLSFATVGEAILIPILDEFKIINTKLGQSIIGIGSFDDIIEVSLLIVVAFLAGVDGMTYADVALIIFSIVFLFLMTFVLALMKEKGKKFAFLPVETLFLLTLFILFLFLGIGELADASALAALLAGAGIKTFLPKRRLELIESEIKTMCYGLFAPLFFIWVGASMDVTFLAKNPVIVLGMVAVSKFAKVFGSYIVGRKELGVRQSILMGIGLSIRFSTSIVIVKLLLDAHIISSGLYSTIIASSIVFKLIVPVLFANLIVRWKVK